MIVASMQAVIDGTFGGATLYGTLQNNTLSAGALETLHGHSSRVFEGAITDTLRDAMGQA